MNFTSQDIVLIEKALHLAVQHASGEHAKSEYREILLKMQASARDALRFDATSASILDGIRYDYDDSSDLD